MMVKPTVPAAVLGFAVGIGLTLAVVAIRAKPNVSPTVVVDQVFVCENSKGELQSEQVGVKVATMDGQGNWYIYYKDGDRLGPSIYRQKTGDTCGVEPVYDHIEP